MRSGPRPCWARNELISDSTPCSSAYIAVVGRSAVAPAGDATIHRLNAVTASATKRMVRLPMHHQSALPAHRGDPWNELPRSGERLRALMAQPVEEDHLQSPCDRNGCERAEHAGELRADQYRDQHRERRQ